MAITGKHTQYGIESFFLIPKKHLMHLLPKGLSLYTKFGLGTIAVGAWKHEDAYVDDHSYGPVLEAWLSIAVTHKGKQCGYLLASYNNSHAYSEPVNNIFKFTKVYADMEWKEKNGSQTLEVRKDGNTILKISGRPTFIPKSVPFSRPRTCYLSKSKENYLADMVVKAKKSRLAFTSIEIPDKSPLKTIKDVMRKKAFKYSVFFEKGDIRIPEPKKIS